MPGEPDLYVPPSILVIDDDRSVRESIADYLEDCGFAPTLAENGRDGLEMFRRERPDLIVLDLRMPELGGLELLAAVAAAAPETPLVVISGTGLVADAAEAVRQGAWDYILKPIQDMAVLEHSVRKNLERARLLRENRRYREELEALVWERTSELERRTRELERVNERLCAEVRERQEAEGIVRRALQEKELLLKEVHHRVKNNLQIISSLLSLQSAYVKDGDALEMFQECRNRVRSMALLHERIYKSEDLARIDFGPYVENLASFLFQAYSVSQKDIVLETDIRDVFLDIEMAVPCSLIINELVSNAVRHAFRGRTRGRIHVSLLPDGGLLRLEVADDGVGFAPREDLKKSQSLGLKLIATLVEQLKGRVDVRAEEGTTFAIAFPAPARKTPPLPTCEG